MKLVQISDHIWSLKLWMLIPLHVWIVKEETGVTLVDAGIPMMAKGILKAINQLQAGPLQQISLTHGHSDHVGAIHRIRQVSPVPVYVHRHEIPCLEGDQPYRPGQKAAATMQKGLAQPLPEDSQGRLLPARSLTPYWTPGHSPGHVVYYHEVDKVLLSGDLFSSKNGKLRKPLFTPNMEETLRSSAIVGRLKPVRLEICHGGSIMNAANQLEAYLAEESKRLAHV
jgi:glyoxylase-like metal-dependent hydrolase (beta-lactamase superfamily II)